MRSSPTADRRRWAALSAPPSRPEVEILADGGPSALDGLDLGVLGHDIDVEILADGGPSALALGWPMLAVDPLEVEILADGGPSALGTAPAPSAASAC